MFEVHFDTANAAFEEDAGAEIARILREIADKMEEDTNAGFFRTVLDENGNHIGGYRYLDAANMWRAEK